MCNDTVKTWIESAYNEDTDDEIIYYLDPDKCDKGDTAYMCYACDDSSYNLVIKHIIRRSEDMTKYDHLISNDNILIEGEGTYKADTSAEFITDDDCYLVWFSFV